MWLTRRDAAPDPASTQARRDRSWCHLAPRSSLRAVVAPALALAATLMAAGLPAAESGMATIELLALKGFDPVSYFLKDGPRAGAARFELSWGGRVWRFASRADRAAFQDNPEVYAPRLGGFDAAGILDGRLVDADPLVFAVIDERLYLFRDAERRARFLADPELVRQAEAAWPGLQDQLDLPISDATR
jgi:YHS domain-containing protein